MAKEKESAADDTPTEELPVLQQQNAVEPDENTRPELDDQAPTGRHSRLAVDAPDEPMSVTDQYRITATLPESAAPDGAHADPRLAELEARLEDKDAAIASLEERLRATRVAVARRDEAARKLGAELAAATARYAETDAALVEALAKRREAESRHADTLAKWEDAESRLTESARLCEALRARLADSEAMAARYAERVTEMTSRLRRLELKARERDAAISDLEGELVEREAKVVARERALAADLPTIDDSREEAAALAAYIDCRRQHWLELDARIADQRATIRDLRLEIEQRAERARRETERADAEARRAAALAAELATTRSPLQERGPAAFDDLAAAEQEAGGAIPTLARGPASASAEAPAPAQAPATSPAPAPSTEPLPAETAAPFAADTETVAALPAAAAPSELRRAPSKAEAALICLTSEPIREYAIGKRTLAIGRAPHCEIHIATHFVSREHARVERRGESVHIEDLGSKNGVYVNAVRVERGVLRHGDLVTIGETQFRFRDH
jgi:hypothetical protein